MKTLTCYGKPYATVVGEGLARETAEAHIRACPEGAMEWATDIRWHRVGNVLVSAANGEWLNHWIKDQNARHR